MSADTYISQPPPRSPATDFQADRTGSFDLDQSSKAKILRNSVNGDHENFLINLKKATRERALTNRLKFAPDGSSPLTDKHFDAGQMNEVSLRQPAPEWGFMAVIQALQDLGFYDAIGRSGLPSMISGKQLVDRQAAQNKMLIARLLKNHRLAAVHLRDGQHEVIIDLKSDFLGKIRMRVISENQQVTVRILVEHGWVKDMIESNLHQLEADMQQQGLEAGKLKVAVACNPEESGSSKEKHVRGQSGQGHADRRKNDREQPSRSVKDTVNIDYFA